MPESVLGVQWSVELTVSKLHYPPYWHYDILHAVRPYPHGKLKDPRTHDALDELERCGQPDGTLNALRILKAAGRSSR